MDELDAWQRLRRDQENVAGYRQLLGQGFTLAAIRANVAAGRWVPLFRGVYALVTGPPTPAMWRWAALLFIRGPAMLSHETAAGVLGLRGGRVDGPIHVTVPYGSSASGCAGIAVHRSKAFAHIGLAGSVPPVTSRVTTVVDLAVEAPSSREGMRVLTASAAAARLDGTKITEHLDLRRPRRYAKALRAAAQFLVDGVQSVLELDYATDVELAHGLPAGLRQVLHRVGDTNRFEDLEYRMPLGVLTVRLDGFIVHANRRTARSDRARDNVAELEGRARLTFGYDEVHDEPYDRTPRLVPAPPAGLGRGVHEMCAMRR
ncbi:hypothetical protein [Actinomycetospora termitidis]|uniref:Transcriptional regulator, AbiEi antitoxin, Type IV TA system n=1 Tax=Actinomycetospora termitidis TaxID=3053470 RepID=A0ABT7MFQ3_9PSEU|nr:hypothetical protein [Actinomycetospora sp. Odt1-22]MDL5158802.1 hypothetical protein [Actinomycetospora sp. Odt1-22]